MKCKIGNFGNFSYKLKVNKNAAKTDKKKASRTKLLIQDKSWDELNHLGDAQIRRKAPTDLFYHKTNFWYYFHIKVHILNISPNFIIQWKNTKNITNRTISPS